MLLRWFSPWCPEPTSKQRKLFVQPFRFDAFCHNRKKRKNFLLFKRKLFYGIHTPLFNRSIVLVFATFRDGFRYMLAYAWIYSICFEMPSTGAVKRHPSDRTFDVASTNRIKFMGKFKIAFSTFCDLNGDLNEFNLTENIFRLT